MIAICFRLSPRARFVAPIIRILSPDHKEKEESESSLTSVARGAAMLALATPLLADRLIQQRPTSFTDKERKVSYAWMRVTLLSGKKSNLVVYSGYSEDSWCVPFFGYNKLSRALLTSQCLKPKQVQL